MQRTFSERKLMKSKFVILLVFITQCGTVLGERAIMIAIILNTLTLLNNQPKTFWKRKKYNYSSNEESLDVTFSLII